MNMMTKLKKSQNDGSNVVQMFPDKLAFGGHELRGVMIEGEPWFVAVDACRCLGLDMAKGAGYATKSSRKSWTMEAM